jgi:hypothetical protein
MPIPLAQPLARLAATDLSMGENCPATVRLTLPAPAAHGETDVYRSGSRMACLLSHPDRKKRVQDGAWVSIAKAKTLFGLVYPG